MYGLEKKNKGNDFEFDLEVDLKKHPEHKEKMNKLVAKCEHEIKDLLKKGGSHHSLDQYNTLLHGYQAFKRVVERITRSK